MKEDQRMNAKSPDPDDLAREDLPESEARDPKRRDHTDNSTRPGDDRSAPHVPPVERGHLRGE